jgi:hypothetical protein
MAVLTNRSASSSANSPIGFETPSGQPELTVRLNRIWEDAPEPSVKLLVSSSVVKNKEVRRANGRRFRQYLLLI